MQQVKAYKKAKAKGQNTDGLDSDFHYSLIPIYLIGILNFTLPYMKQDGVPANLVYKGQMMDVDHHVPMSNSINLLYLCVPNLPYGVDEDDKCQTTLEKLAFCFKHISTLKTRPPEFLGEVFDIIFQKAEIAQMSKRQRWSTIA